MKKPKNILVPVDLSTMSIQGLETAKRLARSLGARVHIVHVSPPIQERALMAAAIAWQETPSAVTKAVREGLLCQLKDLACKCALSNDDKIYVRDGAPVFDVICRLAVEIPADLLVVPTHAFKGVKRFFLGSTAERLIQHSPCPILVDRKSATQFSPNELLPVRQPLRIDKVLVPVDFSKCSRAGLRYAIEFARIFAAKITVLHVLDLGYSEPKDVETLTHWRGVAGAGVRQVLKEVRQEMSKFLKSVSFGRVKADRQITIGPPVRCISDFALANDVDLIITSTHGLTGFKHVRLGSIAEHLVRQSRVPILVVPSHPGVRVADLAGLRPRGK
jgi:nucleotide-binding universal stress UspA family protein